MDEAAIARLQNEIAALENILSGKKRQLETARVGYSQAASPPRHNIPAINNR
ncbi:MAG: hypothetical protein LBT87_06690 [Treponema sp.]|jgi:hypothetical protein|nr:hypothetical protein [Treponema sp.]